MIFTPKITAAYWRSNTFKITSTITWRVYKDVTEKSCSKYNKVWFPAATGKHSFVEYLKYYSMILSQSLDSAQHKRPYMFFFCHTKYGCCKTDCAWRLCSHGNECDEDQRVSYLYKNLEVLPSPDRQAEHTHDYSALYWRQNGERSPIPLGFAAVWRTDLLRLHAKICLLRLCARNIWPPGWNFWKRSFKCSCREFPFFP